MDRVVPQAVGNEIELYMRTYYSLLRSSHAFQIETLVESHIGMGSSLHHGAADLSPDVGALLYSALRLPPCAAQVEQVLIGQMEKSFVAAGFRDIAEWERVFSPGRRRRMHYDGKSQLVVYIVSRSDIDDLLPILTAYQIEWNKLHLLLNHNDTKAWVEKQADRTAPLTDEESAWLAERLRISIVDVKRLEIVWRADFWAMLGQIAHARKSFSVRMISGSLADYRRATAMWWEELRQHALANGIDAEQRPIYFVSSNTHSLVNLLTGFATRYEENLIEHIKRQNQEALLAEYETIQQSSNKNLENFLYYVLGKYLARADAQEKLRQEERSVGIHRVSNAHGFEIEAQVIDLARLHSEWFDGRIRLPNDHLLAQSDALILNIDYPLGMAAYEILSRIAERNDHLHGVYVMGKAATLNARVGDVMIPSVIHDEHSRNTYLYNNCFTANDVKPYMINGNVLDNQKAFTALGTFLQNPNYMSVFYREGYTDIEMEGGPYLSAVYEAFRPKRHPTNELVNLYHVPFDVGFLHYASDAPMKKGQNLGAGGLALAGIEPTYATSIAILRRIFLKEINRLQGVMTPQIHYNQS